MSEDNTNNLLSKCCNGTVTVSTADEGTACYICFVCEEPCDTETSTNSQDSEHSPRESAPKDKTIEEERFNNFRSEILGMIEMGNISVGALGLSPDSADFIRDFNLATHIAQVKADAVREWRERIQKSVIEFDCCHEDEFREGLNDNSCIKDEILRVLSNPDNE